MQIGERLKEARLEKGYSIEDIQQMTKIQTRHLQAIEDNNFSLIPGNFYARVFIKEYANAVDLDATALFAEYQNELPKSEQKIDYTQLKRTRRKVTSTKTSPIATFLPTIIVFILLLGVVFFIWRSSIVPSNPDQQDPADKVQTDQGPGDQVSLPPDEDDQSDDESDDTTETDVDSDDQVSDEEVEDVAPELTLISFENNVSYYQLETLEESLELMIETTGSNWLEVEDDQGERLYYATLQSNESPLTFDVSAEDFVYLRFGEPSHISLSINDHEIELADGMSATAVQTLWLHINEELE